MTVISRQIDRFKLLIDSDRFKLFSKFDESVLTQSNVLLNAQFLKKLLYLLFFVDFSLERLKPLKAHSDFQLLFHDILEIETRKP